MSQDTGRLRRLSLGALPSAQIVKLTISMPAELKAQLEAYAEMHSRLHGPVDAVALIPHMLAAFMARDRGFRQQRRRPALATRSATDQ